MLIITTQSELERFCSALASSDYITVDTEFIREKTYYPQLCLIQIAGEKSEAIIDPLAKDIDLKPVFTLLNTPSITKVFHACRQDIEIFYHLTGTIPAPIFDTQIAASFCGYGESVSYENLVRLIAKASLDKSSRFTDWAERPLSEKQLNYALSDVTHLRDIYKNLRQKLEKMGRLEWLAEEHAKLADPSLYKVEPDNAWMRLKNGRLKSKHLAVLREMAKWREHTAQDKNIPRGRLIKDDILLEMAQVMPRSEGDIAKMRRVDGRVSNDTKKAMVECTARALALPESQWPAASKQGRLEDVTVAISMLSLLLKVQAETHRISAPLIATRDDLEALARGEDTPALAGWRNELFGKAAQDLLAGKVTLGFDPKHGSVLVETR